MADRGSADEILEHFVFPSSICVWRQFEGHTFRRRAAVRCRAVEIACPVEDQAGRGMPPSLPWNLWSTVSFQLPTAFGASLKTTPQVDWYPHCHTLKVGPVNRDVTHAVRITHNEFTRLGLPEFPNKPLATDLDSFFRGVASNPPSLVAFGCHNSRAGATERIQHDLALVLILYAGVFRVPPTVVGVGTSCFPWMLAKGTRNGWCLWRDLAEFCEKAQEPVEAFSVDLDFARLDEDPSSLTVQQTETAYATTAAFVFTKQDHFRMAGSIVSFSAATLYFTD